MKAIGLASLELTADIAQSWLCKQSIWSSCLDEYRPEL